MKIATALTNAIAAYKISSRVDGTCVSLYRGSDFINLTKLTALMLQKVRVKNAEIESKKPPTFGRWFWNTLKDIGEWIFFSERSNAKVRGDEGDGTIKITYGRYILGPNNSDSLLGYKGFEVEYAWAKSTIADVVKGCLLYTSPSPRDS